MDDSSPNQPLDDASAQFPDVVRLGDVVHYVKDDEVGGPNACRAALVIERPDENIDANVVRANLMVFAQLPREMDQPGGWGNYHAGVQRELPKRDADGTFTFITAAPDTFHAAWDCPHE